MDTLRFLYFLAKQFWRDLRAYSLNTAVHNLCILVAAELSETTRDEFFRFECAEGDDA